MVTSSRTAATSAVIVCLSLWSAQAARSEAVACDTSPSAQPAASVQACPDSTDLLGPANALEPATRASVLMGQAVALFGDAKDSPEPVSPPRGTRTANVQAPSGSPGQSGVVRPARGNAFTEPADDAFGDVRSFGGSQRNWATTPAASAAEMAAVDQAFQQAQQDVANALDSAMRSAQESTAAAMSLTGSSGN